MTRSIRRLPALVAACCALLALQCSPLLDPSSGFALRARLTPGNTNLFRLQLEAGEFLTVAVEEPGRGEFHDPVVAIIPPGQLDPMRVVDDGGPGFLPRFGMEIGETGIWRLVVTGREDTDLDGSHGEDFEYRMIVTASAQPPGEADDVANDDAAGAQPVPVFSYAGADVVAGTLTPGDVDWYEVEVPGGETVGASLFDGAAGEFNDSLVEVADVENDDAGPGFLSNLALPILAAGPQIVRVKVTGYDPDPDDGEPHPETFAYRLVLSLRAP